jgi:alpha-beta hydrolase superfamily lysophospholipase
MNLTAEACRVPHADQSLAASLHRPLDPPIAAAVIAHGLFSSMESPKLTRLAQALARAGFLALQFDHSGCGESPGDIKQTSLTIRRDEYLSAAEYLQQTAPALPLCYLGSSMGGSAAILAADIKAPVCLAVWSAPLDFEELYLKLRSQPERPHLPALERDIARHDFRGIMARTSRILFVHGEHDETVPVRQAREGYRLAREPKELLILAGADHRLSRDEDQLEATARTQAWLQRFI